MRIRSHSYEISVNSQRIIETDRDSLEFSKKVRESTAENGRKSELWSLRKDTVHLPIMESIMAAAPVTDPRAGGCSRLSSLSGLPGGVEPADLNPGVEPVDDAGAHSSCATPEQKAARNDGDDLLAAAAAAAAAESPSASPGVAGGGPDHTVEGRLVGSDAWVRFESATVAARLWQLDKTSVSRCLSLQQAKTKGYEFRRVGKKGNARGQKQIFDELAAEAKTAGRKQDHVIKLTEEQLADFAERTAAFVAAGVAYYAQRAARRKREAATR